MHDARSLRPVAVQGAGREPVPAGHAGYTRSCNGSAFVTVENPGAGPANHRPATPAAVAAAKLLPPKPTEVRPYSRTRRTRHT